MDSVVVTERTLTVRLFVNTLIWRLKEVECLNVKLMHKLKLVRGISRDLHAMPRHTGVMASMPYIAKVHERVDAYYASLMHKIRVNCVGFRAEDKTQVEWICQNCACYWCCE